MPHRSLPEDVACQGASGRFRCLGDSSRSPWVQCFLGTWPYTQKHRRIHTHEQQTLKKARTIQKFCLPVPALEQLPVYPSLRKQSGVFSRASVFKPGSFSLVLFTGLGWPLRTFSCFRSYMMSPNRSRTRPLTGGALQNRSGLQKSKSTWST